MSGQSGGGEAGELDEATLASLGEFSSTLTMLARQLIQNFLKTSRLSLGKMLLQLPGQEHQRQNQTYWQDHLISLWMVVSARVSIYGGAANVRSWFKSSQADSGMILEVHW